MLKWQICHCRSVHFDRVLKAVHNEPENESCMDENSRMSIIQIFLRLMIRMCLEEVMAVLVRKGQVVHKYGNSWEFMF